MLAEQKDILAIDDEQVILDSIVKIGKIEGLSVDSTDNGKNALDCLAKNNYRLIISDIMMPVMDGFTLLDELAKRNVSTPVVMTTGYSTFDNAVNSLYRGAIDFIPKPYTIEEIYSVISRGLKYNDVIASAAGGKEALPYVPSPAHYYRIGYSAWAYQTGKSTVVTGITDLLNKTIDTMKSIELLETGSQVAQATIAVKIETVDDMVHHIYSPVSGKIIARNEKILEDISLLEKDPYFEGWIYQIEPTDYENEIKNLIPCCSDRV